MLLVALVMIPGWGWGGRLQAQEITFAAYNVANFSPLAEAGQAKPGKSGKATQALIRVIREINPDILGVCEMGSPAQFAHFRELLSQAGLAYPEYEYLEAADPQRHLALVSRYPIVARHSQGEIAFDADGNHEKVRRGILDVTVRLADGVELRLLGVHLKSKLPTREGEELLRRHEGDQVRRHLEAIGRDGPPGPLLLYGDFNDTRDQPVLRQIAGVRGSAGALTPLPLEDAHGDRWTHYWKVNDVYSRIDFLFVNKAAAALVVREKSYLYRSPFWSEASDHRPLVARLRVR